MCIYTNYNPISHLVTFFQGLKPNTGNKTLIHFLGDISTIYPGFRYGDFTSALKITDFTSVSCKMQAIFLELNCFILEYTFRTLELVYSSYQSFGIIKGLGRYKFLFQALK